jgi:hypothetical protein
LDYRERKRLAVGAEIEAEAGPAVKGGGARA